MHSKRDINKYPCTIFTHLPLVLEMHFCIRRIFVFRLHLGQNTILQSLSIRLKEIYIYIQQILKQKCQQQTCTNAKQEKININTSKQSKSTKAHTPSHIHKYEHTPDNIFAHIWTPKRLLPECIISIYLPKIWCISNLRIYFIRHFSQTKLHTFHVI